MQGPALSRILLGTHTPWGHNRPETRVFKGGGGRLRGNDKLHVMWTEKCGDVFLIMSVVGQDLERNIDAATGWKIDCFSKQTLTSQ